MKITHKITWEVQKSTPRPRNKFLRFIGYTPVMTHVHTMDTRVVCEKGDSMDTLLSSLKKQVNGCAGSDEQVTSSSSGVHIKQFVRDDLV